MGETNFSKKITPTEQVSPHLDQPKTSPAKSPRSSSSPAEELRKLIKDMGYTGLDVSGVSLDRKMLTEREAAKKIRPIETRKEFGRNLNYPNFRNDSSRIGWREQQQKTLELDQRLRSLLLIERAINFDPANYQSMTVADLKFRYNILEGPIGLSFLAVFPLVDQASEREEDQVLTELSTAQQQMEYSAKRRKIAAQADFIVALIKYWFSLEQALEKLKIQPEMADRLGEIENFVRTKDPQAYQKAHMIFLNKLKESNFFDQTSCFELSPDSGYTTLLKDVKFNTELEQASLRRATEDVVDIHTVIDGNENAANIQMNQGEFLNLSPEQQAQILRQSTDRRAVLAEWNDSDPVIKFLRNKLSIWADEIEHLNPAGVRVTVDRKTWEIKLHKLFFRGKAKAELENNLTFQKFSEARNLLSNLEKDPSALNRLLKKKWAQALGTAGQLAFLSGVVPSSFSAGFDQHTPTNTGSTQQTMAVNNEAVNSTAAIITPVHSAKSSSSNDKPQSNIQTRGQITSQLTEVNITPDDSNEVNLDVVESATFGQAQKIAEWQVAPGQGWIKIVRAAVDRAGLELNPAQLRALIIDSFTAPQPDGRGPIGKITDQGFVVLRGARAGDKIELVQDTDTNKYHVQVISGFNTRHINAARLITAENENNFTAGLNDLFPMQMDFSLSPSEVELKTPVVKSGHPTVATNILSSDIKPLSRRSFVAEPKETVATRTTPVQNDTTNLPPPSALTDFLGGQEGVQETNLAQHDLKWPESPRRDLIQEKINDTWRSLNNCVNDSQCRGITLDVRDAKGQITSRLAITKPPAGSKTGWWRWGGPRWQVRVLGVNRGSESREYKQGDLQQVVEQFVKRSLPNNKKEPR